MQERHSLHSVPKESSSGSDTHFCSDNKCFAKEERQQHGTGRLVAGEERADAESVEFLDARQDRAIAKEPQEISILRVRIKSEGASC